MPSQVYKCARGSLPPLDNKLVRYIRYTADANEEGLAAKIAQGYKMDQIDELKLRLLPWRARVGVEGGQPSIRHGPLMKVVPKLQEQLNKVLSTALMSNCCAGGGSEAAASEGAGLLDLGAQK